MCVCIYYLHSYRIRGIKKKPHTKKPNPQDGVEEIHKNQIEMSIKDCPEDLYLQESSLCEVEKSCR